MIEDFGPVGKPHRVLNSFSRARRRLPWSYLQTGTLPRLISFVCHSYENTGGVGAFFPFWNQTALSDPARSASSVTESPASLVIPFPPSFHLSNSLPLNLFADPHPLNPVVSILYKNIGGQGCGLPAPTSDLQSSNLFFCQTSENPPVSSAIATLPKTHVPNPLCLPRIRAPGGMVQRYRNAPTFHLTK